MAVHPLVLLSVVDHYNRVVTKNKDQRVVGILLGIKINIFLTSIKIIFIFHLL